MITEKLLLENGYRKFDPDPSHKEADALYQKEVKSSSTSFFIDVYKYSFMNTERWNFNVQLTTGVTNHTFDIISCQWEDLSWAEDFFRRMLVSIEDL